MLPEFFKITNQIEKDQLIDMTNDILKELVPSMGPRLKILAKIKEMKEQLSVANASLVTCDNTEKEWISSNNSEQLSLISDSICSNNTTTSGSAELISISESTPILFCDNNNILTYLRPNQYEDFCLKTLLTTTALGKSVLMYYNTYKKLDNTHRNRLCSIIVKHLYNYITKNRLRQEEYNSLAAKIITLFSTERIGTYYVPPIKKNNSPFGKSMMAKGKLVNQVKNTLFRSGDTNKRHIGSDEDTYLESKKKCSG
ncbi:unnamed protein product [Brassicogethes aeneus]|uniref:Uncharacterized protein n=1 Tax=Brassicogethes aeneus TaxID=1431903 RepID=A0A9P0AXK0_BRAAE|nr:unnamed protein product [Brassicogethes aeneus]